MANGYGSSSSSTSARQSMTNAQGQVAPPGFHYMPDGSLMSDAEHQRLYSAKNLQEFDLDLSNLPENSTTRSFTIIGDDGAEFLLEVKNNANGYYYNFKTGGFQVSPARLERSISGGRYLNNIIFPSSISTDTVNGTVSSATSVTMDTAVASTMAVGDRVTGNAALDAASVTVASIDSTNVFSLSQAMTIADGVTLSFASSKQYDIYLYAKPGTKHADYNEVRFEDSSLDINSSKGSNSLMLQKVIYQYPNVRVSLLPYAPASSFSFTSVSDNINLPRQGNNNSTLFSISATAATDKSFQISRQPTANDILSYVSLTVGSAPENIDGENIYPAVTAGALKDGTTSSSTTVLVKSVSGTISEQDKFFVTDGTNLTVTQVVDGISDVTLTSNLAVSITNNKDLDFYNRMNYQWPLNDISKISEGMIVLPGTNVTAGSVVSSYSDFTTQSQGTIYERKVIRKQLPALNTKSQKPTFADGVLTVQPGNVIFNNQQKYAFAGDTVKIAAYGTEQILSMSGYSLKFTDLKIELTEVTTTTTSAVHSSTTIPVAERKGTIANISTISGIGVDSSVASPTVTSATDEGAGSWTASTAQTLEKGATLTIGKTGKVATITGKIEIVKAGRGDIDLNFDVERLLISN
tara:strand:- start:109 stop:2016 length:1908 start_codon:yes stop_codon:yes gene_type:complete